MFDAGRTSVRPSKTWPVATLAMSGLAMLLAVVLVVRPTPAPVVQVVHVPVPKNEAPPEDVKPSQETPLAVVADRYEPDSSHAYGRLQDHLLRFGLDLPAQAPLPQITQTPMSDVRVERGATGTSGLFTSWWLSRGSNQ